MSRLLIDSDGIYLTAITVSILIIASLVLQQFAQTTRYGFGMQFKNESYMSN